MADETTAPTEKKEEPKMATCPCCGQETIKRPVKVDGKIIDDYLASIMTGVPFSHTFPMFDGRLKITVSVADKQEGLVLYRFVFMTEPFAQESSTVRDFLGLVNTYCSIRKIIVTKGEDQNVYMPAEHVIAACRKIVDVWEKEDLAKEEKKKAEFLQALQTAYNELIVPAVVSSTPMLILNRILTDFRTIESLLLEAGFDENFWKGIELQ